MKVKTLAQMNAERADRRAGHNLKLKNKKAAPAQSFKLQAWQWLNDKVGLIWKKKYMSINSNKETNIRGEVTQLRRIADILDEILRLVKKDMETMKKAAKWRK